jgi:hypothetical protein
VKHPLIATITAIGVGMLTTSCQREAEAKPRLERPALPELKLRPMLEELRTLAGSLPVPDDKTQRTLQEYADISLGIIEADTRTANRVQRALLEHQDAWFVLEPALAHELPAVRQRAAWLCGDSQQTVLQVPLLLRLKYELDPATVIWVADALAKLGNDSGLMWLAAAFTRPETANQAGQMAMRALTNRDITLPAEPKWAELSRQLKIQADNWRQRGVSARLETPQPDAPSLRARLARQLQTPEGTQLRPVDDARFILTRLGAAGVPMLTRTLQAEEHYLRTMPLQILAELGAAATGATGAILPLLSDPLTASYAVRALGEIGATSALPHLRPLLEDPDTELRAATTQAVGLLGDTDSAPLLEARLQDPKESMDVRVGAAFGLLCLGEHPSASAYLAAREAEEDYHGPTLTRLLERLASRDG